MSKGKMKIAVIRRIIFASVFFIAALPTMATANEVDGFRLGMTMEQAVKVAAERGYSFSKVPSSDANWTSYALVQGGPIITFCGNVLSSMSKSSVSNLHEFANLLERWTTSLGAPDETAASQKFVEGAPFSNLGYKWVQENVRPSLSFFQVGTRNPQMSYGYSYINHPCRPSTQ